jgi:hypothetical protein
MRAFGVRSTSILFLAVLATTAHAATWTLVDPVLVDPQGTSPSAWGRTIAYLIGSGGPVAYYDGDALTQVYPASVQNYEPALAAGVVAWRNCQSSPSSNETFRWDGTTLNISNSPNTVDSDVAVAANGDVIWSESHHWLRLYIASVGATKDLNIAGVGPTAYLTAEDVLTYAYQDPDTQDVLYFNGYETIFVGQGFGQQDAHNAHAALCDGAVAYIGPGVGDPFTAGELFFWRDGVTTRITDDDAVNGIPDDYPSVWNDVVVWQRALGDPTQTRIFLWDGTETTQLTTTRTMYPSFQGGWLAYVDFATGLYSARVIPQIAGDCSADGLLNAEDFVGLAQCLNGPDFAPSAICTCGDLDADHDVDLLDVAALQRALAP